jgi:hypothetical protein
MRKVEALYLGATTPGERAAAGNMLQRLKARIAELQSSASAGSSPCGRRAKWRRPRRARGDRGRWVESNGSVDASEQEDGKARVTFRLNDRWAKYLLLALASHHRLKPYRNPRWPELTVVLAGLRTSWRTCRSSSSCSARGSTSSSPTSRGRSSSKRSAP